MQAAAASSASAVSTATASGFNSAQFGATIPPWSAAHAYTNLYGPKAQDKTINALAIEIDEARTTDAGLASAIRVYVLNHYRKTP